MASFGIEDPHEHMRLFSAILNGKVRQVDRLLRVIGNIDVCDEKGKTPLMCAVCCEIEDVRTHLVRMLLRHGCDVNIQDMSGLTALMYACKEHERVDIVRIICRNKSVDVNICDHDGLTALMHAINSSNLSAVAILLENSVTSGMDLKIRNKQSLNALELAVKLQMADCCQLLVAAGAKMTSVRDQKGLQLLLEREVHNRRKSMTQSSRSSSALKDPGIHTFASRSMMGRDSTLDKEVSRLVDNDVMPRSARSSVNSSGYQSVMLLRDDAKSTQQQRRVLTPIKRPNQRFSPAMCADASLFGHKTKLPSIPSGKKLYLVANSSRYEDPSSVFD